VVANILNKQSQRADKRWSSSLGARTRTDSLDKRHKLQEKDKRFGTWNARSLYKADSLMAVAKEISKCELDLVGVQEVRWDGGDTEPAGEYIFLWKRE
jgi:hypothetical protein